MLEFVRGPHGQIITEDERASITKCLTEPHTFCKEINKLYNNAWHFSSQQYNYDITTFLREISDMISSQYHTLQVIGGIHSDPGHSTSMIGQYSQYQEFIPATVRDTYIRFKIIMDPKHTKMLRALDSISVFHFLTQVPFVLNLPMHSSPVYMQRIPNINLAPQGRYKRMNLQFT
jgi:hypothetical protein